MELVSTELMHKVGIHVFLENDGQYNVIGLGDVTVQLTPNHSLHEAEFDAECALVCAHDIVDGAHPWDIGLFSGGVIKNENLYGEAYTFGLPTGKWLNRNNSHKNTAIR